MPVDRQCIGKGLVSCKQAVKTITELTSMVSYRTGTQWKSVFLSTHHPSINAPSIPQGPLVPLAVSDTVVAACFCCRSGIWFISQEFSWLVQETYDCQGKDRRHGFLDFAFPRWGSCKPVGVLHSVEGCPWHLAGMQVHNCRLCTRTSDSPARQRHARWEIIDHQRSTRTLNWGSCLASLLLCLALRNFGACFRWRRRAGGAAFALAPEPFQGILRPSLPDLLWSDTMIISCGTHLSSRTLHCHLMLMS